MHHSLSFLKASVTYNVYEQEYLIRRYIYNLHKHCDTCCCLKTHMICQTALFYVPSYVLTKHVHDHMLESGE